jgi:SHS2 domain-containing protein
MNEFETFEHGADVGIRGFGETLERAFENTAKAMFSIMVDIENVGTTLEIKSSARANSLDNLLVEFLNDLLLQKDLNNCMFSKFIVEIIEDKRGLEARYKAFGERIPQILPHLRTEVKGATFTKLSVVKQEGRYLAQCIVDV